MSVNELRDLLRQLLVDPAPCLLAAYYDRSNGFAAATFDTFGANDPFTVGADDLLAVSMLDIAIKPRLVRRLLDDEPDACSDHLRALPTDLDLWDATAEQLHAVDEADQWLRRRGTGVQAVVASKLLARKRPRLVPVMDSTVLRELGQPPDAFLATRRLLAQALGDTRLQGRLRRLREPLADEIPLLRVLDVVLWMRGSRSRAARRVQADCRL